MEAAAQVTAVAPPTQVAQERGPDLAPEQRAPEPRRRELRVLADQLAPLARAHPERPGPAVQVRAREQQDQRAPVQARAPVRGLVREAQRDQGQDPVPADDDSGRGNKDAGTQTSARFSFPVIGGR